MKILLTFIGNNDCDPDKSPGAILSILRQRRFDRVYLLYNKDSYLKPGAEILRWCQSHFPDMAVEYQAAPAENPTDYNVVYPAMYRAVKEILKKTGAAEYTISLTSGTPTMHACWIFLQQGRVMDAELIQVSREGEISAICFDLDDFPKIQQISEMKAEMTRLSRENRALKSRLKLDYDPIIGDSPAMLTVREQIRILANTDIPVFIQGESGTGKELAAEAIHYNSPRKEKPLIRVNCGAISPELFESEFFGHKKGAFTGAVSDKPGFFRLADGGTLFLDEIADLPKNMQAKLLRVLDRGSFMPVGANKAEQADVRIISAANRDLREMVQAGAFREDLFYRMVHTEMLLPPLRERGNDRLLIAQHILAQLNQKDSTGKILDKSARDLILKYYWPGNVRQLKNCLETAFAFSGNRITAETMNIIDIGTISRDIEIPDGGVDLNREILPKYYEAALKKTGGNQAKAARLLGLEPATFRERLRVMKRGGVCSGVPNLQFGRGD
jgi:two-component system response regulator PilR (NtrC family)